MNESVIRSPKWLRNMLDFEINTGEDIKGEPSKKRQKQIEVEAEKTRKQKEKEEEEKREQAEKKEGAEFDILFKQIINYIYTNYKDCKISIPDKNFLLIESINSLGLQKIELSFRITLDNNINKPTFSSYIKYGKKEYNYKISGLGYIQFKNFLLTTVYQHYKNNGNQSGNKNKNYYDYDDYKNSYNTPPKSKPKPEDPEREKKKKRYNLLKNTKSGYLRQMEKILDWEKKNPGQKHPDNKQIVKNEMDAVQSKIDLMNSLYHFESHHYSNIKPYEIY